MEMRSISAWVVAIFLIFAIANNVVNADRIYSCWGGCYNQCSLSVKSQSENFPCYYKCLNGCVPRTAADFQYYCQIGCSLKLCTAVSIDGAAMETCFGKCTSLCNI